MGGTAVTVIRKVRSRRSRDGDECVVGMRREQTPLCRPLPSECDPHPLFLHARHATTINVRLKVTHWSPFRPDINPSFISIEIQLLVVLIRLVHGLKSKCPVTIDALSDDVLLEIFKIHLEENHSFWSPGIPIHEDLWFTLVHVCHRWRCLVSASPRTLGSEDALYKQQTGEKNAGCLAGVAHRHKGPSAVAGHLLDLGLRVQADILLCSHLSSFPLLTFFSSTAIATTWKPSFPELTPLNLEAFLSRSSYKRYSTLLYSAVSSVAQQYE
jgi:hypothetical protein